jgi:hypothetical protein
MESKQKGTFNAQAFLDSAGVARTIVEYRRAEVIVTQLRSLFIGVRGRLVKVETSRAAGLRKARALVELSIEQALHRSRVRVAEGV